MFPIFKSSEGKSTGGAFPVIQGGTAGESRGLKHEPPIKGQACTSNACKNCGIPLTASNLGQPCELKGTLEEVVGLRQVVATLAKSVEFWANDSRVAWGKCEARRQALKQLKKKLDEVLKINRTADAIVAARAIEDKAKVELKKLQADYDCKVCRDFIRLPSSGGDSILSLEHGDAIQNASKNVAVLNRSGGPIVVRISKGRDVGPGEPKRPYPISLDVLLFGWVMAAIVATCAAVATNFAIWTLKADRARAAAKPSGKRFL